MSSIGAIPLPELSRLCAEETNKYYNQQAHDPRYCFELFRRAISNANEQAWERIYSVYHSLVARWVRRHPSFVAVEEEAQYFINRAFEKMWTAVTAEKWSNFPDLAALLRYLQMCVNGVIVDFGRQKELAKELSQLDLVESNPEPAALESAVEWRMTAAESRRAIWEAVGRQLKDDQERRVIYGMFVLALKPRELVTHYPETFADANEVYRVKENVLNRLRRSDELNDLLREG
jgi:hypothetical protein